MRLGRLHQLTFTSILVLILTFLCSSPAFAYAKYQNWIQQGGGSVTVAGIISTTTVQQSFKNGTITVYLAGTSNLATIYSDNNGTPLSNPFTNQNTSTGQYFFYAANGAYDVTIVATGLATYTLGSVELWDAAGQIVISVAGTASAPAIVGPGSFYQTGWLWAHGNSSNLCAAIDGSDAVDDLGEAGICINSYGLGVGASPAASLHLSNNITVPFNPGTSGFIVRSDPVEFTDTSSSGSVGAINMSRFNRVTLNASNPVTYSVATNIDIAGCPIAGTNVTISGNCVALGVEQGFVVLPSFTFNNSSQVLGNTGACANPVYSFGGDPATGPYLSSSHVYTICTNGLPAVHWDGSQNEVVTGSITGARFVAAAVTTANNQAYGASSTTGALYGDFLSSNGETRWGTECNGGGCLFVGSSPNAAVYGSIANVPIQLFVNNAKVATWDTSKNQTNVGSITATMGLFSNAWAVQMQTPSTPADNATCNAGSFTWDSGFIYVCTVSGIVKRATLNTY